MFVYYYEIQAQKPFLVFFGAHFPTATASKWTLWDLVESSSHHDKVEMRPGLVEMRLQSQVLHAKPQQRLTWPTLNQHHSVEGATVRGMQHHKARCTSRIQQHLDFPAISCGLYLNPLQLLYWPLNSSRSSFEVKRTKVWIEQSETG